VVARALLPVNGQTLILHFPAGLSALLVVAQHAVPAVVVAGLQTRQHAVVAPAF
jgi:hypothetical protein